MRFARPEALWLAALALPVIALHLLRPRRTPLVVSSTEVWRSIAGSRPVSAADPWQKLRASVLLALQLAAVLLLALAAAGPQRISHPPLGPHTVYVFDGSASMGALDGAPGRIDAARERALDLRRGAPAGSVASVVAAGARPTLLLEAAPDEASFERAVDDVAAGEGPADLPAAFAQAVGLSRADRPVDLVLLTDGALDAATRRLVPPGTREVRVGDRTTNRAITRLAVEERAGAVLARVTVANLGGPAVTQTLHLDVDGVAATQLEVDLPAGATVERDVELPAGEVVEARLDGEDLLSLDDSAVGVVARRRGLRVLLDGPPASYLDTLLQAIGGVTVERPTAGPAPAGGAAAGSDTAANGGYDLAIYEGIQPPATPGAPVIAIAPPGGYGPVQVTGGMARPAIVAVAPDEPVTAGIDLSEVRIEEAQQLAAPGTEVLVGGDRGPLLVRGESGGSPFAYLGFHLADSDLPLQVAFPLLFDRLIDDLAQTTLPTGTLQVGEPLPVPPGVEATIEMPAGRRLRLAPGDARPLADRAGIHRIEVAERSPIVVAVNPPTAESDLHGGPALEAGIDSPGVLAPDGASPAVQPGGAAPARPGTLVTPLLPWLAAALLAVAAAELLSARRHRGVGRAQWWLAVGARAATAGLVVAALVDPRVTRVARGVATVFVVDASDSVSASGQADEAAFLQAALEHRPRGARSAVVRFGGDARLSAGLGQGDVEPQTVHVDPSRTNLAGALQLGAALLPDDARRRLVLLSDGRRTEGDEDAVLDGLRRRGVQVDVVTTRPNDHFDVAVAALDGPASAHAGEQLKLTATLTTTAVPSGPVDVLLRRDGEVVASAQVTPVPGAALAVPFTDVVPDGAPLRRYQVEVRAEGDGVAANDRAYLGVRVEGPARVLVVEGSAGEGAALARAMRAGGLGVDVVGPQTLPPLDALGAYAASVLVDVDARSLSAGQLDALTTTVSDLGRGLTVLGGPRAYGPGGYRDTPLEDLLPVVSEINDPKRQRSVAEVLAIDTSGSMGSCHCSGGAQVGQFGMGQNRVFGGVNKTDISRSAAARSIEALRSNDEMGVLAITNESRWVIDLQKLPAQAVVDAGLRSLRPDGSTDLSASLRTSAEALRRSKAQLRHIVLFTDGFTRPRVLGQLALDAAELSQEGITTSVVATGEGADMAALEAVATAGGGRFYAGKDLHDLPQVIVDETVLSSRRFINEGVFTAEPTSDTPVVGGLTAAPPLLGFVGTSAKPSATTLASVGPERDPLLATWQAGLGRVTAWTSDASLQWAQQWPDWAGYVGFWTTVVKDTFREGASEGGLDVRFGGDELSVQADSTTSWPDETAATVRVTAPDGSVDETRLERLDAVTFRGEVPAPQPGTYAVGVQISPPGGGNLTLSGTANRPYAEEYRPGQPDTARLARLAAITGGRVDIAPEAAFEAADLPPGRRAVSLAAGLLIAAALAWVVGVALSRLLLRDLRHLGRAPGVVARRAGVLARRRAWSTARPPEEGP